MCQTEIMAVEKSLDFNLKKKEIDWEKAAVIFAPEKKTILKKLARGVNQYFSAKDILTILAIVGVIGLTALAPGLGTLVAKEVSSSRRRADFNKRLRRLEDGGYIEIIRENGEPVVKITKWGMERALHYKFEEMTIKKPVRWDKKWRVVIFDIPEDKKRLRDRLRQKLQFLGFYALNRSVFVHPYPCFDEIEFIRQVFSVGGEVTYLLAEDIENKTDLLSYFNLD